MRIGAHNGAHPAHIAVGVETGVGQHDLNVGNPACFGRHLRNGLHRILKFIPLRQVKPPVPGLHRGNADNGDPYALKLQNNIRLKPTNKRAAVCHIGAKHGKFGHLQNGML
jgi:hypothetical protein